MAAWRFSVVFGALMVSCAALSAQIPIPGAVARETGKPEDQEHALRDAEAYFWPFGTLRFPVTTLAWQRLNGNTSLAVARGVVERQAPCPAAA